MWGAELFFINVVVPCFFCRLSFLWFSVKSCFYKDYHEILKSQTSSKNAYSTSKPAPCLFQSRSKLLLVLSKFSRVSSTLLAVVTSSHDRLSIQWLVESLLQWCPTFLQKNETRVDLILPTRVDLILPNCSQEVQERNFSLKNFGAYRFQITYKGFRY